jgi:flavoprotein
MEEIKEKEQLITKKYIKKNGDEVIKKYNQNKYNETYYNKHKDELFKKHNCECGGVYLATNKFNHFKTRIHKLYTTLTNKQTI